MPACMVCKDQQCDVPRTSFVAESMFVTKSPPFVPWHFAHFALLQVDLFCGARVRTILATLADLTRLKCEQYINVFPAKIRDLAEARQHDMA